MLSSRMPNLTGYRRKKEEDIRTHATFKFPTHNLELLEKWKKFANLDSLGKHSALCELHFNENDIRRSGMRTTLDWKKDSFCSQFGILELSIF